MPNYSRGYTYAERVKWLQDHARIDQSDCWNCQYCMMNSDGYPRMWYEGTEMTVCRLILILQGIDMKGQDSRHTCNNTSCINPRHIIPGSRFENMRDRARTNGKKDNREKKPATSHKGVYWNKACQVLFSQIKINNIGYYLGDYGSEKHAALAYQLALNDYEKYGILPRSRGLRGRVLAAFRPRKRL